MGMNRERCSEARLVAVDPNRGRLPRTGQCRMAEVEGTAEEVNMGDHGILRGRPLDRIVTCIGMEA